MKMYFEKIGKIKMKILIKKRKFSSFSRQSVESKKKKSENDLVALAITITSKTLK